jgi:hypothetical protein
MILQHFQSRFCKISGHGFATTPTKTPVIVAVICSCQTRGMYFLWYNDFVVWGYFMYRGVGWDGGNNRIGGNSNGKVIKP